MLYNKVDKYRTSNIQHNITSLEKHGLTSCPSTLPYFMQDTSLTSHVLLSLTSTSGMNSLLWKDLEWYESSTDTLWDKTVAAIKFNIITIIQWHSQGIGPSRVKPPWLATKHLFYHVLLLFCAEHALIATML